MELQLDFDAPTRRRIPVRIERGILTAGSTAWGPTTADRFFIVHDEEVAALYGEAVADSLAALAPVERLYHRSGEVSKCLASVSEIAEAFFDHGGTATSAIVALGGGVTGNMAGLLAAVAFRGIQLIHVPTTLIAQLDSAVDVKSSVNAGGVKNSIGAIYAPTLVVIDPEFLATLDERHVLSGLAEAMKHGFSQDPALVDTILNYEIGDLNRITEIISWTCRLKIQHYRQTPGKWGSGASVRRLTHLGHAIGKVLEVIPGSGFTHGEAIARGMVVEGLISRDLGYLPQEGVDFIATTLEGRGLLDEYLDGIPDPEILSRLYRGGANPQMALLRNVGDPSTIPHFVEANSVRRALAESREMFSR